MAVDRVIPAVSALVFAAVLVSSLRVLPGLDGDRPGRAVTVALVVGLLYILSHAARALRLAIIAMPILGISFRTAVLLHFFVAPWSLVLPFKLDELVRLTELVRVGRSAARALLVSLIDRSMDGIVLVAMALYLLHVDMTGVGRLVGFLGAGLSLIAFSFLVLPVLLEATQRHVFYNHYGDHAFRLLKVASNLRRILTLARRTILDVLPFLVIGTLCIWGLELLAAGLVARLMLDPHADVGTIMSLMLTRTDATWRALLMARSAPPAMSFLTISFYYALLVIWPVVTVTYLRRIAREPRRAAQTAGGDRFGAPARREA